MKIVKIKDQVNPGNFVKSNQKKSKKSYNKRSEKIFQN